MKILNLTSHDLCFYDMSDVHFDKSIRKFRAKPNAKPYMVIPNHMPVSVDIESVKSSRINGIPTVFKIIKNIDPLPEGYDVYIVSAIYAEAFPQDDRVFTISQPVVNNKNEVIGCLAIGRTIIMETK